jgi:hypothetical protein
MDDPADVSSQNRPGWHLLDRCGSTRNQKVVGSNPTSGSKPQVRGHFCVARKVITDAGSGEFFIHRTGHGIGLTTHEPPYMVEGETRALEPGMCFSIEPGIYLPGRFGVRIEDIVTVTRDAGRRLNDTSHELRIVS